MITNNLSVLIYGSILNNSILINILLNAVALGSSTRETSSRTGGAHCWLALGRFQLVNFKIKNICSRVDVQIGKKYAALKNSVLPSARLWRTPYSID